MKLLRKYFPPLVITLVFTGILVFYLYRITYFNFFMFDELYYSGAAMEMYENKGDSNFQHPPLGKWLISLPFYIMGDSWSLSWRIAPLVFGFSGLVVTYFFAKRIGLVWWQSLVVALCLVGSVSWYVLSRTAMLDIFLSFFVVLSAYIFYVYLEKNKFSRDYSTYSHTEYLLLAAVVTGLAGLCKWSGFFPFLFYLFFYFFYLEGTTRKRVFHFLLLCLIPVYIYFTLSLVIYKFDYTDVAFRTYQDIVFHNSSMLPESNPTDVEKYRLVGGYKAFLRYFLQNEVYIISSPYMTLYGLVNNQLLAGTFLGFTVFFVLSGVGYIIRRVQRVTFDLPIFFTEKSILFNYFYAFSLLVPWLFIPRVQYSFYYVPAFPFIVMLVCYYLFKYCNWKLAVLFLICYFAFFFYWLPVSIPL